MEVTSTFANPLLKDYVLDSTYDEMFSDDGRGQAALRRRAGEISRLPPEEIARRKQAGRPLLS